MFGDSGPFFALVGVSLASGTGILTKEEELEGVCWEIRVGSEHELLNLMGDWNLFYPKTLKLIISSIYIKFNDIHLVPFDCDAIFENLN